MRVVDLFCGIGGFSEGARAAGHRVVLAVDADQGALDVHTKNHPECVHVCTMLPPSTKLPFPRSGQWHLHGSPPCQKVSQANRQVTAQQRTDALALIKWFLDLIPAVRPTQWSFEQVPTPAVRELLEEYARRQPSTYAFVIVNCAEYGTPQDRRRLIAGSPTVLQQLLASRGATPIRSIADTWRTLRLTLPASFELNHSLNTPDRKNGGYRKLLPREHMRSVALSSYTICASTAPMWANEDGSVLRRLTARECAHLQTFPASYNIGEHHCQRYVGNAMPPEVARRLVGRAG